MRGRLALVIHGHGVLLGLGCSVWVGARELYCRDSVVVHDLCYARRHVCKCRGVRELVMPQQL